jgi:signal-transduction protein with cAMP-binding, CBS, and nucleotidyltransferase domain
VTRYIYWFYVAQRKQLSVAFHDERETEKIAAFFLLWRDDHPSFYVQRLRSHTRVSIVKRLKVRDVIGREVAAIDPSLSLLDAANRMVELGTDALIVSALEKDEPFGIITQKDVVDLFADEVDIGKVTVGEAANKPLFIVSPGMPILYAAKMFRKGGVHHLAVFNGQEILGIISYRDVLGGLPSLMEQVYSEFE